jgi:hypothetical protein
MDSLPDINFIDEKRRQENELYSKIKSKNRLIVKNLILEYDISKRTISLLRKNFGNYQNLYVELNKFLEERKEFINSLVEKF